MLNLWLLVCVCSYPATDHNPIAMMKWECFVCWKVNAHDEGIDDVTCVCCCCGRSRNFVPTSVIMTSQAKPLVLHGLTAAQHQLHPKLVQGLQQAGLDLAAADSAGWTALHCAAVLGDATAVRCLLHPTDENRKDFANKRSELLEARRVGGWRALHLATRRGHVAVVEELLLVDADVNGQLGVFDDALAALHIAAGQGHADILDLLLQCGADPTLLTHHLRRSPLHVAVFAGHEQCVRLLLAIPMLAGIRDADGLTALQLAHLNPSYGRAPTPVQQEIIALLETNQQFGATQPIQMNSLLG